MLIEELFGRGIMTMGPSRADPARQVGVFRPEAVAQLPAMRAAEMGKFRWIAGEWSYENEVPASRHNPAYVDIGSSRFALCEKDTWVCGVAPDGAEGRQITFDPFSRQWIYMLARGSYGLLRSAEGWIENRIAFSGTMTMIGITCEWRMTWTKENEDAFGFVNEELGEDGAWHYIDRWRFLRK
ncbi:MAG: hypothetical protein JO307_01685 [Bryobacterales bacterium]|nr:hypothetical protein [Bryobacterales bacterium]MBV9401381.1 hypothetical protein [Bryobacterales bacterium]